MPRAVLIALIVILVLIVVPAAVAIVFPARVLNTLTSRSGYAIERDIAYGDLPRQRLDIYRPTDVSADAPIVVFIHGGGWRSGSKDDYLFVGQSLATAGFIVVIPNYRLYPEAIFPAFVADAAKAVAFTRDRLAGSDGGARPLFLAGHSAGAQIAALLNLDKHYLRGAGVPDGAIAGMIGIAGPYDFLPLKDEIYKAIFPEAVRAASQPIAFADGDAAPMLLVTGDADRTVGPGNTTRLAAAVEAKGGAVTVKAYPGLGHLGMIAALATLGPWPKTDLRRTIVDFVQGATKRRAR